jgi:hypothetical protein
MDTNVKSELNFSIPNIYLFSLSLAFALAYTQFPLFSSNQNTYFVHGLAKAGIGFLKNDWLVNTLDPFPLFSLIVQWTTHYLHVNVFYIFHTVILFVYFYSMSYIITLLAPSMDKFTFLITGTVIIFIHSWGFSFASRKFFGNDLQTLLTDGVADQSVLGPMFQPSIFGVFLILSISLFLFRRTVLSVIALSIAACFHANYILPAGVMTICYMIQRRSEGLSILRTLGLGLLALILILPVLIYDYHAFAPTSQLEWEKAMYILQYIRTPHHSLPAVWFNYGVIIKIILVIGALSSIRRTRIFNTIFSLFLLGIILTMVQYIFEINTLSHLFPWRVSVIIVPISALILINHGIVWCTRKIHEQWNVPRHMQSYILVSIIFILMAGGIAKMADNFRKFSLSNEMEMTHFVEDSRKEGDVYLVPCNMERFRIETGVPIVADWKSFPYSDHEILDWNERIIAVDSFYRSAEVGRRALLQNLHSRYGVTHIVMESGDIKVPSEILMKVYEDKFYRVYKLVLFKVFLKNENTTYPGDPTQSKSCMAEILSVR